MSHISGVKRALSHTNSFTGERLPKYGVETLKEEELGHVSRNMQHYHDNNNCHEHEGRVYDDRSHKTVGRFIVCPADGVALIRFKSGSRKR